MRVAEIMHLKKGDVKFLNARVVILLLPESKGAKRKGQTESVMIRDPTLVKILRFCVKTAGIDELVFGGTYRSFAKAFVEFATFFRPKACQFDAAWIASRRCYMAFRPVFVFRQNSGTRRLVSSANGQIVYRQSHGGERHCVASGRKPGKACGS